MQAGDLAGELKFAPTSKRVSRFIDLTAPAVVQSNCSGSGP